MLSSLENETRLQTKMAKVYCSHPHPRKGGDESASRLDHPWFFRKVFPFSFLGLCCFPFVFLYKQLNHTKLQVCAEWTSRGLDRIGCLINLIEAKKNREALGARIPSNFRFMAHFLRWLCLALLISYSPISLIRHVSGKEESLLSGEDHCLIIYHSKLTKCLPLRGV